MKKNGKEEQRFFMKRKESIEWLSQGFLRYAWGIFLFAILFMYVGRPAQAYAASYKAASAVSSDSKEKRTANGITFSYSSSSKVLYATKNGKKTKILKVSSSYVGDIESVVTDGNKIYFAVVGKDWEYSSFYRYTFSDNKLTEIAKVEDSASAVFAGYYNGTLFYVNGSASGSFCSLNTSTGKAKVIIKGELLNGVGKLSFAQIGKYIWLSNQNKICYYNAETGKTKTIGKNSLVNYASPLVAADSTYIYYVISSRKGKGDNIYDLVSVIRCKPDGTQKKTLLKNIKVAAASGVTGLTSKSITYMDLNEKTKTKKF